MLRPGSIPRQLWLPLTVVMALLMGARGVMVGSSTRTDPSGIWVPGRAVPIEVDSGRAVARWSTPQPGSRAIMIVSALAQGASLFTVEAEARRIRPEQVDAPRLARDGARRPSQLARPALPGILPPPDSLPPRDRVFHLLARDGDVASASNYDAVRGVLQAVGKRVQVYVDRNDLGRTTADAVADIVATFDEHVFPIAARSIGQARDVDGDGRFTVLISSLLSRLAGGRHAVDGFVRCADLDRSLPPPFSNHCDMMYLSAALPSGAHLRTVLAHEYTHAVAYGARAQGIAEEEGWLDEAMAHMLEDQHRFSLSNLDYRVSAFLSQPDRYRLVVDDYYAANLFRSHGNRGATYLFLRWCVDRFGDALIPALMASEARGVENLERATGRPFADLYREWTVALSLSGADPRAQEAGGYRSLDLRRPFGSWPLAGPRTTDLVPGQGRSSWTLGGTTSRFLLVESSNTGAVEVEVRASPRAQLQVTVVPLPVDLPRLNLAAALERTPAGVHRIQLQLEEQGGFPAHIDTVSWEPLTPPAQLGSASFRFAQHDSGSIPNPFPQRWIVREGVLVSHPIARLSLRDQGPLVVKAVASDAKGRRVAAWQELRSPAAPITAGVGAGSTPSTALRQPSAPSQIGPASRN
ncbi:MAG: hypothetical protein U0794_04250 [Isosphaeraceae bacterium]